MQFCRSQSGQRRRVGGESGRRWWWRWRGDGMGWGGCGGSVTGRGRGSGCFTRPLTFTSLAFQSAVSIKDGCCSSVSPIHHHRAGAADGRLGVMEGERVCWEGGGSEVGRTQLRLQREEFVSSFFWEKCFQVQTEKKKASGEEHPQRAEAAICPGICFAQGGTTVLRWESKCAKKNQQQQQTNKQNVSTATIKQLVATFPHQRSAGRQSQTQINRRGGENR